MALSEAKKAADKRHMEKLDNIMVRPYRKEGEAIRAAAAAANQSVQGYILQAVRERMEHERARAVHDDLPADGVRDEDTPRTAADASPTQDEISSPSELSPDDWAEWARRRDDESLEDWKSRLKQSNIGTSPIGIMKRIGKLPKHDRDIILGTDPARDGKGGPRR